MPAEQRGFKDDRARRTSAADLHRKVRKKVILRALTEPIRKNFVHGFLGGGDQEKGEEE
jgi:hypothetical protein